MTQIRSRPGPSSGSASCGSWCSRFRSTRRRRSRRSSRPPGRRAEARWARRRRNPSADLTGGTPSLGHAVARVHISREAGKPGNPVGNLDRRDRPPVAHGSGAQSASAGRIRSNVRSASDRPPSRGLSPISLVRSALVACSATSGGSREGRPAGPNHCHQSHFESPKHWCSRRCTVACTQLGLNSSARTHKHRPSGTLRFACKSVDDDRIPYVANPPSRPLIRGRRW